jgi:phosphoglycerol transferase MdoB-like AlkP superfamily enzyme
MHLIPSAFVVATLVVAWRREWIGTILFAAAGLAYVGWTMQHPNLSPAIKLNWILIVAGPVFVIAALFLMNWMKRAQLHAST